MKKFSLIAIFIFIFSGCLKAKKSPFDISKPTTGFVFGFISLNSNSNANQGAQTFSVSGTITGLTTGNLILQNNGKDDLTLTSVDKYSITGLASGATYSISVKSHPTGLACTLTKAKGTISANITDAHINCTAATANALYTLGDATKSYWLDYVKADGTSPLDATGATCTGSETGYYNSCIHAGEFKKVAIPNIASCDGITASDSLSAFNWKCLVATDSSVSVISTGLRGDKGLSDLIDFTSPGSFRNNTVTILLSGNSFLTTTSGKWWDNTIVVNNGGGVLSVTKTIYIVTNNTTVADYRINVASTNKMALVVQPGILKALTNATAINIVDNRFLWIEGNFQATAGILLSFTGINCSFNVVRNFRGVGNSTATIYINNGTSASLFTNISGTNLAGAPAHFLTIDKDKNIFNNIQAYNVSSNGIDIISQPDNIILNSFSMNTDGIGINVSATGTANNLFINSASFNTPTMLFVQTSRTTIVNFLGTNGANYVINNNGSTNSKFINTIAAHAATDLVFEGATANNSAYLGISKFSGTNCNIASGTSGLTTATCVKANASLVSNSSASVTGITLANSFVGKLTSTDSKNTTNNATGAQTYAVGNDWLNFENRFRGWGNQGGAFPNNANTGRCAGGTCQIWDWSLKATDTVARNVNGCPNGTIVDTHQWSAAAANQAFCDANYKGSSFSGGFCVTTFLRNAVEIFGDGVGNENGICESNEECLYTPNIGAYQGHSSDSTNTTKLVKADTTSSTNSNICPDITTGGTITNVKLWKYDTNGY